MDKDRHRRWTWKNTDGDKLTQMKIDEHRRTYMDTYVDTDRQKDTRTFTDIQHKLQIYKERSKTHLDTGRHTTTHTDTTDLTRHHIVLTHIIFIMIADSETIYLNPWAVDSMQYVFMIPKRDTNSLFPKEGLILIFTSYSRHKISTEQQK